MEILKLISIFIGWIFLFFAKKLLYKLILSVFQLITRQLDFIGNKLTRIILPINGLGFPRILLSFILIVFSIFMLGSEYGSLETSMKVYFPDASSNIMTVHISKILAITYIAITLILGIIGLELIGFRHIIVDLLFENKEHNSIFENWSDLKENSFKPLNFFKILVGIIMMAILFYFAHMQGIMAIDREILIHEGDTDFKKSEILDKLLYALGFFIPILAGITFMSLEIFLATVAKLLLIIFTLIQKGVAITYDITKRTVEIITSPVEFVTQRINYSYDNKYQRYLEPIEVKSITADVNELTLFKAHNKENTKVDEFADHISSKIEDKLSDGIDDTIDELF